MDLKEEVSATAKSTAQEINPMSGPQVTLTLAPITSHASVSLCASFTIENSICSCVVPSV